MGSRGGPRHTRHLSVSTAALHSRSCCASAAAATTKAGHALRWPPYFQCSWYQRVVEVVLLTEIFFNVHAYRMSVRACASGTCWQPFTCLPFLMIMFLRQ